VTRLQWFGPAGAAVLAGLCGAAALAADDRVIPANQEIYIDGNFVACGDNPLVLPVPPVKDLATASPWPNVPAQAIVIDNDAFQKLPTKIKIFIYYQSCGLIISEGNEANADAYAVQFTVASGLMDRATVAQMCGTDILKGWSHKPDAKRCETLLAAVRK
jgi:hypothetical protein